MKGRSLSAIVVRRALVLFGVAVTLGLAGCASTPKSPGRTHIVLLPDEDGRVGMVSVAAAGATTDLNQAWQASTVEGGESKPSAARLVGAASIQSRFASLFNAQPPAPKTFVVYFLVDKAVLTEESKAQLPAVLAAIRERSPTEVTIFGHADPSGTRERNLRLSAERAQAVADWIRFAEPTLVRIRVQHFGDTKPPGGGDAGADLSEHRRAEIQIL